MPSHAIRRQIELAWEEFWKVGVYDSAEILEQILYLLFLRRLDHQAAGACAGAVRLAANWGPPGADAASLHWSAFSRLEDSELFAFLSDHVYPRLRAIGGPGAAYARHLKDVRFAVPTPRALGNIVRLLDALPGPSAPGETDPFDYVADKLARIGPRADSYTPHHIEMLMVALVAPVPEDVICSPASGSGNFMVAALQHLLRRYPALPDDPAASEHCHHRMFHAYDADRMMLRIGCMRMLLHGLKNPNIHYTNAVQDDGGGEGRYSVILAHPSTAPQPLDGGLAGRARMVGMKVAQFVRMLRPGGRAAVIVPEHILSGGSDAERNLRRMLMHEQRLDAVVPLPRSGVGAVPCQRKSLLLFTRTDCGGRRVSSCAAALNDPMAGEARCGQCNGGR